jgi:hypothetical protein
MNGHRLGPAPSGVFFCPSTRDVQFLGGGFTSSIDFEAMAASAHPPRCRRQSIHPTNISHPLRWHVGISSSRSRRVGRHYRSVHNLSTLSLRDRLRA